MKDLVVLFVDGKMFVESESLTAFLRDRSLMQPGEESHQLALESVADVLEEKFKELAPLIEQTEEIFSAKGKMN